MEYGFPDESDILAEEEYLASLANEAHFDEPPFEDEPPDISQLIQQNSYKPRDIAPPQVIPPSSKEARKRQQDELFGDLGDSDEEFSLSEKNHVANGSSRAKRQKTSDVPASKVSASSALNNLFVKKTQEVSSVVNSLPTDINPVRVSLEPHFGMSGFEDGTTEPIDRVTDDTYLDRLEAIIAAKNVSHTAQKTESSFSRRRRYAFKTIPDTAFQSMTNSKGERMYMLLKKRNSGPENSSDLHPSPGQRGGLLSVPISTLKLEAEKEKEKKELAIEEAVKTRLESFGKLEYKKKRKKEHTEKADSSWLESYRPQKYFDLLSNEATNRALLRWLKLWDKVVFNREVKIRPRHQDGTVVTEKSEQVQTDQKQQQKFGNFKNRFQKYSNAPDESVIQELDDKSRPVQKVALLCGPPGLGKTTLAHVVASHAGYNVVEMNASDDRSAAAFKLQLENATQMQSVVKSDPRPNCLIIDEIDGAPVAAINVLLSYIQGQDGEKQKGKKKKDGAKALQRPVICICNDLYTPSLRQLRQAALVLTFPPTESSRLAHRLLEIATEHNIETDLSALLALCEKSENDIRACLATLYFFRLQGKSFRFHNVCNSTVGLKDSNRSLFRVWQDIFQKKGADRIDFTKSEPNAKKESVGEKEKQSVDSKRYSSVLHSVQSCGEYERLVQGVYENYLAVKFRDNKLDNVASGLEWMCFYDLVQDQIQHTQNYSTMGFIPHMLVKLHFLFASSERPKINFPKTGTEMHGIQSKNENIIKTLMLEMAPSSRVFTTPHTLVLDTLPIVVDCLTPNFRPISTQLYSPEERLEVLRVVTAMISLSMTYRQERTPDGQYVYVLDPNIEDLIYLDKTKQRRQLTYASKQLIAREIGLEKMRRSAGSTIEETLTNPPAPAVPEKAEKVIPNHLQTLKPKTVNVVELKPARDFFGRIISKPVGSSSTSENKQSGEKDLLQGEVWFRFKEGYSNAVRRKVRVKDFL